MMPYTQYLVSHCGLKLSVPFVEARLVSTGYIIVHYITTGDTYFAHMACQESAFTSLELSPPVAMQSQDQIDRSRTLSKCGTGSEPHIA